MRREAFRDKRKILNLAEGYIDKLISLSAYANEVAVTSSNSAQHE